MPMLVVPLVSSEGMLLSLTLYVFLLDWTEFMNYMLIENNTLSSMKKEHFEYVKSDKPDAPPGMTSAGHAKNITCMITIKPEDLIDTPKG